MQQATKRRMGRGIALAVAAGATLTMATMGTAQAAAPGVLKLCSKGSYASYASFPERGGFATYVVPSGKCDTFDFGGNRPERVDIVQSGGRIIGSVTYDGRAGLNIATVDGPSFYPF
ncbi:hypothetical protein SAMN05421805_10688 [Saccharopolyspora antimicrobica]|uniref:Peptidase inhibitor family I36 n=1 Tax=Saccharopolyspora antimicrobica TaxID=455193 RepID=A0A1I5B240_9PSEU|nr:hypothetical protein [Saccharopolyspora antimicrobica]RKT86442.1 hypothetical protein ATL45_4816 [Saccharopolyspora antimicrobica]SFN68755.1 hypothetical protein SAMN05421805_10688 [Saccharopolyspora antimicrobica]